MNLTTPKLKPVHIGIIGALLAVIVGGALGWFFLKPLLEKNNQLASEVANLQSEGSEANEQAANKELAQAKVTATQTRARYTNFENRYFRVGPANQVLDLGSDVFRAHNNLSREQANVLGPLIQRWIAGTGNQLTQTPSIAAAPADPNAIISPVIRIDVKNVKTRGSFESTMRLLRSTPGVRRLVRINDVALSAAGADGDNGNVLAVRNPASVATDLDLSVFIFTRNADKAQRVPVPTGGDGGAPGGPVGGAVGGPPMPGGPPSGGGPPGPPMPGPGPGGPPPG